MAPRPRPEPRVELLEVSWRFLGPSRRTLECGLYAVETGLELRVGYSAEDLVRTQLAPDIATARSLAAAWRQALIDKGGFTEVPMADLPTRSI